MNNSPGVHIIEREADLDEPVEYLHLREELVLFHLPFDVVRQVADFAILHDDDQLLQREITLLVGHDVLVVEILQQIHLQHRTFLLFLLQAAQHDLFGDVFLLFCLVHHQESSAEVASTYALYFLIVMFVLLLHYIFYFQTNKLLQLFRGMNIK